MGLILIMGVVTFVFWNQKQKAQKETFEARQEIKRRTIAEDSLQKLSDGYLHGLENNYA